jgi:hypothetical protein
MVNCFGLSAVEMQGMGHWFTVDHQVQIEKSHSNLLVCDEPVNVQFCIFPPMKQIWVPRCFRVCVCVCVCVCMYVCMYIYIYIYRERERERERESGGGGNRNGG